MNISFRTRQMLRRVLSVSATVIGVTVVLLACLLLWLQRFVVYTEDGVVLDFDRSYKGADPQLPEAGRQTPEFTIAYRDTPYQEGLDQLSGYYIPEEALKDPEAVQKKLENLPAGTPVMIDVKGYRGFFFYPSSVSSHYTGLYDIEKVDALLRWMGQSDLYVIARMPALRDFAAVEYNGVPGLTTESGSLYADGGRYAGYWMDPSQAATANYLIAVLNELKNKGVDEVVLQNFEFPDAENLVFRSDREEALLTCAEKLISACVDDSFAISFADDDPTFRLPDERCRLYLENISAEDAASAWEQADIEEKRRYLVFIAPNTDTRYDIENGILRPLS